MSDSRFDAAIIGGGIAGCAAAINLARQGKRVVLLEAKGYPHHKVCGEFLSPECTGLLDELGLTTAIQAAKPATIDSVAIVTPDGTSWETELPAPALGISRYTLDHLMALQARACGVDLREHTTVTDIEGNLDTSFNLSIRTSAGQGYIQARVVVGAQGKRSSIDRTLNRPFLKKPQPFVGLKAHFYGSPLPGRIHLYTFLGGYCGMSAVENGLMNVCLLVRQEIFQRVSTSGIPDFLDWMKGQNPLLGKWLSTAQPAYEPWLSIAQIPFGDKEMVVNGVLMAGDAAGLIAPVAGDGMGMALQASQIAARLLDNYLTGQISAEMVRRQYQAEWWRTFGVRLRLSRLLQEVLLRPTCIRAGLRLMNATPSLGRFLVNHTRDRHLIQQ